MSKEDLKQFLQWLEKYGIARGYFIEDEGEDNLIERYLELLNQNKEDE